VTQARKAATQLVECFCVLPSSDLFAFEHTRSCKRDGSTSSSSYDPEAALNVLQETAQARVIPQVHLSASAAHQRALLRENLVAQRPPLNLYWTSFNLTPRCVSSRCTPRLKRGVSKKTTITYMTRCAESSVARSSQKWREMG
jgi:hypothetical protein